MTRYIECKHCGGLIVTEYNNKRVYCSTLCQSNFFHLETKVKNLFKNPQLHHGTIAETIRVLHNNWCNLKYTKHFLTKTFDNLIDSGYIIQKDIQINEYKLSDKFYRNFNEIGIDKNIPI